MTSMNKKKNIAFNVAFCGIMTAVAVIFMFLSIIPSLAYAVPAFAGIAIWTVSEHMNRKWAYLCYAAAALLSLVLIPEVEANLFFIFFFGYYPTLCIIIGKIKNKVLRFITKLGIFNIAVVIAFNLTVLLLSAEEALEGMEDFGEYAVYIFWGLGNLAFLIYDYALNVFKDFYIRIIKPKIASKLR